MTGAAVQAFLLMRPVAPPPITHEIMLKIPKSGEDLRKQMLLNRAQWGLLLECERHFKKEIPDK